MTQSADYWPAYPGPQSEVDEDERDGREVREVPPPVLSPSSFRPDHQHRPHPPHHQEVRRAPSFVERIREAEANPKVNI